MEKGNKHNRRPLGTSALVRCSRICNRCLHYHYIVGPRLLLCQHDACMHPPCHSGRHSYWRDNQQTRDCCLRFQQNTSKAGSTSQDRSVIIEQSGCRLAIAHSQQPHATLAALPAPSPLPPAQSLPAHLIRAWLPQRPAAARPATGESPAAPGRQLPAALPVRVRQPAWLVLW